MPYPNEHSARLKDPGQYDEFRRQNDKFGSGIHAIFGIKKGPPRTSDLQAIRFDAKKFTVQEAKDWLKKHNHKYISFEPASGEKESQSIPQGALRFKEEDIPVEVAELQEGNKKQRRFSMVAHSGKAMLNHWYWGNFAIDLKGISIGRKQKPALRDHNSNRIVGWSEDIRIDETKGIIAEGIFSEKTEDGKEALALAEEGFPWQASIYIPPLVIERIGEGEEADVNGYKLKGPGTIFRKSILREVSFCALGADENTSASALKDKGDNINLDVEVIENKSKKKEVKEVEISELTLETLRADRSDLVDALLKEGKEIGSKEGVAMGVKEERERILGIQEHAKAFGKMDDLASEMIKQGVSVDVALGKFKDKRLADLEAQAPKSPGPNASPEDISKLSHLDRAKAYQKEHGGSMTDALKATANSGKKE